MVKQCRVTRVSKSDITVVSRSCLCRSRVYNDESYDPVVRCMKTFKGDVTNMALVFHKQALGTECWKASQASSFVF